ncbi:MAG: DUF1559 domain-containing protein [Pirellulales bacterium]
MKRTTHSSRAFTLVELLVVIAIIGILVALLLPAIQAAREAARRSSCTNNLKNLGLGVLNHHDVMKHFPVSMGAYIPGEGPTNTQTGAGWILNTLPQLEEQSLYDRFRDGGAFEVAGQFASGACLVTTSPYLNKGLNSKKNGISVPELMKTQLTILNCPSDGDVTKLDGTQYQWSRCDVARTSYKGVLDDTMLGETDGTLFTNDDSHYPSGNYSEPPVAAAGTSQRDCHRDFRCRGIFFRQSFQRPVKIAKVTDGTSKTLMIGEDVPEYNHHSTAFYANGDWCSCNIPLNYGMNAPPPPAPPDPAGGDWWNYQGFRSLHPGGMHFCLADGSVRFVSESIDGETFRTSCTRDGGEVARESL